MKERHMEQQLLGSKCVRILNLYAFQWPTAVFGWDGGHLFGNEIFLENKFEQRSWHNITRKFLCGKNLLIFLKQGSPTSSIPKAALKCDLKGHIIKSFLESNLEKLSNFGVSKNIQC